MKYSDMLLVEITEPLSLIEQFCSNLYDEVCSLDPDLDLFVDDLETTLAWSVLLVIATSSEKVEHDDDEVGYILESAESFTPLRRNLLCFLVCSLALWIELSQSLHRTALSS